MMSRCGAAALALTLVTAFMGPAHAQTSVENWATGVVRAIGKTLPIAAPGATKAAKRSTTTAQAPDLVPPLPERKKAEETKGHPPKAVIAKEPETWSPGQIAKAKAHCTKLLKDLNAVAVPQSPIRNGKCGAPAPIKLVSLGAKKDKVRFSPPALVTCDMAAALAKWIRNDVQPLAVKHLGNRIAKIEVMSDYSCRNVAGLRRLSEHALANALDIRGFVTQKGTKARVLGGWGKTKKDLAAEFAAAKAKADAIIKAQESQEDDDKPVTGSLTQVRDRSDDGVRVASKLNGPPPPPTRKKGGDTKYAALSPPPPPAAPPVKVVPPKLVLDGKARFLRAVHAAGCRTFGTTLGPEANKAHRNHFHVDMAERKWKKICD